MGVSKGRGERRLGQAACAAGRDGEPAAGAAGLRGLPGRSVRPEPERSAEFRPRSLRGPPDRLALDSGAAGEARGPCCGAPRYPEPHRLLRADGSEAAVPLRRSEEAAAVLLGTGRRLGCRPGSSAEPTAYSAPPLSPK